LVVDPVGAAEVRHDDLAVDDLHLAVLPREPLVGDVDIRLVAAAQRDGLLGEDEAHEDLVAPGDAYLRHALSVSWEFAGPPYENAYEKTSDPSAAAPRRPGNLS